MMKTKTVDNYSEAEFERTGFLGTFKNKKKRRSVILPLLLSVIAAVVIWLLVLAENNTCSGVKVQVIGNEQLMSCNYTVSAVEPSSINVVVRGKADIINQIKADKSLITAAVYVFPTEDSRDSDNCIFNSAEDVRPGTYTVDLAFTLPDGVRCSTKSVKVTISESYSEVMKTDGFKINFTNYSLNSSYSLGEMSILEDELTVSGDEETVHSISSIGLNVDWHSEVSDDIRASVSPVAYDSFGGALDSSYLHFEPEQLTVSIAVNRTVEFPLSLNVADDDTGSYTLTQNSVTLSGPARFINAIGDKVVLNEEGGQILPEYLLDAGRFGSNVKIVNGSVSSKTALIGVTRTERVKTAEIHVPIYEIVTLYPSSGVCSVKNDYLSVRVEYAANADSTMNYKDLLVVLDLSGLPTGEYELTPSVAVKSPDGGYFNVKILEISPLAVTVSQQSGQ